MPDKSKSKHKPQPIIYGNIPEWFEIEMSSRPRQQRECFYHPPSEVTHTPHEWIDGPESGRRYGAWRPVKQMATLDELFEGYEENEICQ